MSPTRMTCEGHLFFFFSEKKKPFLVYFIFGMIIDICLKFYLALSPPYDLEVKVTEILY